MANVIGKMCLSPRELHLLEVILECRGLEVAEVEDLGQPGDDLRMERLEAYRLVHYCEPADMWLPCEVDA